MTIKKIKLSVMAGCVLWNIVLYAQKTDTYNHFDPDSQVITSHIGEFNGRKVAFKAITGTLPVYYENNKVIAGLFFTYYQRTNDKQNKNRPIAFLINGGPGSATVWLQMGFTGPVVVNLDQHGVPVQPYSYRDNAFSILDVSDLVFINTVNTAYSRKVNDEIPDSLFFRPMPEVEYLTTWINTFINRFNRWSSPVFLIGESYGTVRVSEIANKLHRYFIIPDGVVLIAPTTLGIDRDEIIQNALQLVDYSLLAWYHRRLAPELQLMELKQLLTGLDNFLFSELIPALCLGSHLPPEKSKALAAQLEKYTGLSKTYFIEKKLKLPDYWQYQQMISNVSTYDSGGFMGNAHLHYLQETGTILDKVQKSRKRNNQAASAMIATVLDLPHISAVAWYHGKLSKNLQQKPLRELLEEVEYFTINKLVPACYKLNYLTEQEKLELAAKMSSYTGLSQKFILAQNMSVTPYAAGVELLREEGSCCVFGLDSRFKASDMGLDWLEHAFSTPVKMYLHDQLNYQTELNYVMSSVWWPDEKITAGQSLYQAMQRHPTLRVMAMSGYYDGACSYSNTDFTLRHLDPSGASNNRIIHKVYEGGHMMYLVKDILRSANDDLREFILNALPASSK